jgi:hypothetical protein
VGTRELGRLGHGGGGGGEKRGGAGEREGVWAGNNPAEGGFFLFLFLFLFPISISYFYFFYLLFF